MADNDVESEAAYSVTDPSSIESIQETSEETSLLATKKDTNGYQSADISSGDASTLSNEASQNSRSPIGIIALLLIGIALTSMPA